MNILIFIIVLGALIFIHELGHFLFAKLFKVRVDEFGFGYPPKMFSLGRWKETELTMNWIPFGGFVRLFGESDTGEELTQAEKEVSLVHKPRWQQFLVMFGGILFNIIFAWLLLSVSYMGGIQSSVNSAPANYSFEDTALTITSVMQGGPAFESGLMAGDVVLEFGTADQRIIVEDEGLDEFSFFVNDAGSKQQVVDVVVLRDSSIDYVSIVPEEGIIPGKFGIGVGLDQVGELKLGFFSSLGLSAKNTVLYTGAIVSGFGQLFTGEVAMSAVSGPVGIVSQVGEASALGFTFLLGFTALLSLNLAVLNAFPFPALDGGRMLILIIESVIQKRLNPKIVNWVNLVGFFVLIGFMLLVTIQDVINLF